LNNSNFKVTDLLRLQQIDNIISHNLLEIEQLKDNEELKSRSEELEENNKALKEAEDSLGKLEKERRKFEDNISLKTEKIKKNEGRLSSGTITNAKELVSLQEEIVSLKKVIEELENKMLDIMIEIDDKTEEVNELKETSDKLGKYVSRISDEIEGSVTVLEEKNKRLNEFREEVIKRIPEDVYEDYESLKKRKSNIAIGYVKGNICSACNMELSVSDVDKLNDVDALYKCPLCRRSVVLYSEEVGIIEQEISEYNE
jgi:uncharacterized protein